MRRWNRKVVLPFLTVTLFLAFTQTLTRAFQSQEEHIHLKAGLSYLAGKKLADAVAEFEKVLGLNPSSAEAYFYLSQIYVQTEEWPKALDQLDRAIQLDSKRPEYYNQRGLFFSQQEQFNKALPDVLRAIELKPAGFLEYYYFNLALVDRDLLRPEDAITAYQKTLLIDPGFYRAHLGLAEI
jgi:Tfp pilus assembly protein PilF